MDSIIPEDISYLSFLNDKNQSLLLQNNHEGTIVQENTSFGPILTELVDGNATWTIGGVPIFLNESVLTTEDEQNASPVTVEHEEIESRVDDGNDATETVEFPIEIPGKGFITSSGLFFSNEVLMQLNLQNDADILDKPSALEIISQQLYKNNDTIYINNVSVKQEERDVKAVEFQFNANLIEPSEDETNVQEKQVNDLIEVISVHKCKNCSELFERYEDIVAHIKNVCQEKVLQNSKIQLAKKQKMSSLLMKDENKMPIVKDIYLCGMCENVGCENLENLKRHMLAKHNVTYNGAADQLQEGNDNKLKSKSHFQNIVSRQQLEARKVKCLIKGCDARFAKAEIMMKHHECHLDAEKKKFKCPECDKVFFIWRLCSAHLWKCHKIDIGLFTCVICNTFKSLSSHNLLVHMSVHDTAKPFKPFLCSTCGKDFRMLAQLKNHESVHKQHDNAKWISKKMCSICTRTFSDSKVLKKHIQAVHNKYKPFICNICGHKCARKAMLELHLRQHTGEKPYKCDICDYKTGDHNSLRRHTSRHLGETKYSCPHCDYQTIQSIAYKLHIKRKHPGKEGFFSCLICSFDTVNENMYQDHLKVHSIGLANGVPLKLETVNKNQQSESSNNSLQTVVPNVEDEETQTGLFSSDHLEDMAVDTGGITIPADSELQ